ncbi:hypothetical protein [Myxococcus sp. RHSTA-1-4]|uniref:hypothetical protein n=1 Tax=Myxococcus sp. RHSTA-1-4 TaxID=2874601 RepID=UPI001CC1AEB7|nr:hypothetical protein [Myxococcus sp. RHSTA-1-4]MBZ4415124.1 hypothetical protein [Myxococcus sp. RHSTA-1-4]
MKKTWGRVAVACLGLLLSGTSVAAGRKTCEQHCDDDVKQCKAICKKYAGSNVAKCQSACSDQKKPCMEACAAPARPAPESRGGAK